MSSHPESSHPKGSRGVLIVSGIAVLVVVVWYMNRLQPSPGQPKTRNQPKSQQTLKNKAEVSGQDNPVAIRIANTGSHSRLALLDSFFALDSLVVDRCFAQTMVSSSPAKLKGKFKLIRKFTSDIKSYQSLQKLETFGQTVDQMMRTPVDITLDGQLEKLRKFPGSGPVLANNRNLELLSTFSQIIDQRIDQLQAHKQIKDLKTVFEDDWHPQFMRKGIEVSFPGDLPSENGIKVQHVLRHWALSSTRFLLGISGNTAINEHIQRVYPGKIHPIYSQALNAVLDPAHQRFRTIATYQPPLASAPNSNDLLKEAPNGPIALVEFTGAIPRAKLFSDWQQGIGADLANEILYSPGFNPHAQVLLGQEGLQEPEQPAATIDLPSVKIELIKPVKIVLKAPSLEHNAVLFLNDPLGNDWTVSIDGQTAEILRANNTARAVYLKPKKSVRTVEFVKRSSGR